MTGYSILVVDDEEGVRRFVDRAMKEAGYQTVTVASGSEALAIAATTPFNMLITDLMMPEMTGDELARRLRTEMPGLKVLYLTGYSDQLFHEKITLWKDEAFLEKPATLRGLLEAVSLLLTGRVQLPEGF